MAEAVVSGVYQLDVPEVGAAVPLVLDSPHSGTLFPDDFGTIVPLPVLRRVQDNYVDQLFAGAEAHGATLLRALFPRSYIDPNRAPDDIDQRLLSRRWAGELRPTDKTRLGHGLVWRTCPTDRPMYDRKLEPAEVEHRIKTYWRPYHGVLEEEITRVYTQFGRVWHINCHSMPSGSAPIVIRRGGGGRADFVLGDRDGRSSDPLLTRWVKEWLEARGYVVRLNDPYKGAYLVEAYSDPARDRHSLQIEINRALYMDEGTLEKRPGFASLASDLNDLVAAMAKRQRDTQISAAAE